MTNCPLLLPWPQDTTNSSINTNHALDLQIVRGQHNAMYYYYNMYNGHSYQLGHYDK